MKRYALLIVVLGLLLGLPLAAQESPNLESGLKPYGTFHGGDLDSIGLFNGNLAVHIPLSSYPQRGKLPLDYFLVGNTKNWEVQAVPDCCGGVTYRWTWDPRNGQTVLALTTSLGYIVKRTRMVDSDAEGGMTVTTFDYGVESPDGSLHRLDWTSATTMESVDASGFRLEIVFGGGDGSGDSSTLVDRNGVRYKLNLFSGFGSCSFDYINQTSTCTYSDTAAPNLVEDPNGNTISSSMASSIVWANTNAFTFTDSLGRTLPGGTSTTDYTGCQSGTTQAYLNNLPGPNGTSAPVKFCFANFTVSTAFTQPGVSQYPASPVLELATVVLPNGTKWLFNYDSYGEFSSITLPTGGTLSYTWTTIPLCAQVDTTQQSRAVATRTVNANDGTGAHTWTYTWGPMTNGTMTNTVTDPSGNDTVHVISDLSGGSACGYYETQTQYYQGTGGARTLLKTVNTQYSSVTMVDSAITSPALGNAVPTVITTTTSPGSKVSKVEKDYDTGVPILYTSLSAIYGNVVQQRDYDFQGAPPWNPVRKTIDTYVWQSDANYKNLNLLDLVASTKICSTLVGNEQGDCDTNNSLKRRAETDYAYDQSTLVVSGISTQHDANPVNGTRRGNLTTTSRWLSTDGTLPSSTVVYYDTGMVQQSKDPLLHPTTYTYSSSFAGAYLTQVCNALNQCTSMNYDFNTGLLSSTTDPNSKTTTYAYDIMSRLTQENFPDTGQVTFSYNDSTSNPSVTITTKITSSANATTTAVVDGLGRLKQTQLTSDPEGTVYADTTHDANGRKGAASNPYRSTTEPTYGVSTYQYDGLSRVTKVIPPDGSSSSNNVATLYTDNCAQVTDQAGKTRKSCSDGLGRLTQVFEPDAGGNFIYETDYTYDALDNLLQVQQKGNDSNSADWRTRTFTYDSHSRLTQAFNPESGTISYTYDADGNLVSKVSPLPNQTGTATLTTSYCYDQLHRLLTKAYVVATCPMTSPAVSYFYDQTSYNGLTILNGIGRRTGMTDASSSPTTVAWSYDEMGRAKTERRTIAGVTKYTKYQYNLDGSLSTLTYPGPNANTDGRTITYTYNGAGRALSAVDTANHINYATAATYAPQGALSVVVFGQVSGGFSGITNAFTYNKRLQPVEMLATTGTLDLTCTPVSGKFFHHEYAFALGTADNGNVQTITNCLTSDRTQSFTYDQLNRVATAKSTATSGQNCWGEQFTYDIWGNLLQRSATQDRTGQGCTYEALSLTVTPPPPNPSKNQIVGYCYDAAGNLNGSTACPNSTYLYDNENRLSSTAGVTYTYDGDGKRVAKSSGKLYWTEMGSDPLDESDAAGNFNEEYVFFNGKRIARVDVGANNAITAVHYYFADHLSSADVVTSAAGAIEQESDYYPFGGERAITAGPNNYKFTGKERDSETGLDYFGKRYLGSSLGRFMSPDSIANDWELANPHTWNRYTYARNNPIIFVDPEGAAVELFQQTDQERQAALQEAKKDVGNKEAADRLYINKVKDGSNTRYFIGIKGDVGDFMKLSETAHDLANLVVDKQVVEFGVTKQDLSKFGGAVTYEKGEAGNNNVRVLVNPSQVNIATANLSPDTIYGATKWAGQMGAPSWRVNPFTPAIAEWHEMGHSWGFIHGRGGNASDKEANAWENRMRQQVYGPLGPNNAPRVNH